MPILDDVKAALRISQSSTAFDGEINDLIASASYDLRISGVLSSKVSDYEDSLIKRSTIVYCKANFGFDNPDAERLQKSYDMLKTHLALSQEYTSREVITP